MGFQWTQDAAIAEIDRLLECITPLSQQRRLCAEHSRWIARTLILLEEVFGRNSQYYVAFNSFRWHETSTIVVEGWDPAAAIEHKHQQAYRSQLETARGLLLAARDHLERADIASVYKGKDTPPESSTIIKIISLTAKLRKLMRDQPQREVDVQNAFEDLLTGADIPHSREAESFEYSSKTYRPDFTMPKIDLVVEIKLCNRDGREKDIIAEINDDILAYRTKYGNVLFVVYDLGLIRDTERFIGSFEQHQNVVVRVVKH